MVKKVSQKNLKKVIRKERRKDPRIESLLEVEIFKHGMRKPLGTGNIINLSFNGARVDTFLDLKIRESVVLSFVLHRGEYMSDTAFKIKGEVETIWKKGKSVDKIYGLKFVKISVIDKERLREFVNYRIHQSQSFQ